MSEPDEDEDAFNYYHYDLLMSMLYNVYYCRKRLARRLIKLRMALDKTEPRIRDLIINEGKELLGDQFIAKQVAKQTRQHPRLAAQAAADYEFMFGA